MSTMMKRPNVTWRLPSITGFGLKMVAGVTMLLGSIGSSVIQDGIIHLDSYTQEELSQALSADPQLMTAAGVGSVLQLISGLAVPLFAFLVVEGFRHTSDYRKYLLRVLFFAFISEIPFDLAMQQSFLDFSAQNAMFGIAVSLMMLYVLDLFKDGRGAVAVLARVCTVIGALVWVALLRVNFGPTTVLLAAVFYLFYARNVLKTLLGLLVSAIHVTAPLSFYLIWFYNEERNHREWKYAFYVFYPLHLLALGVIVTFFMARV